MQNGGRGILATIENYIDMLLNVLAIYIAYFFTCLIDTKPKIFPNDPITVIWILVLVILCAFMYQALNVYKTTAVTKTISALWKIIRANIINFGIFAIVVAFFAGEETKSFLLIWTLIAMLVSTAFLTFKRRIILSVLSVLHSKQYVLRKIIIIGDNTATAKAYVNEIANNPGGGAMILGYVGNKIDEDVGCDKLGTFRDLVKVLDEYKPTEVVFAIDSYNKRHLIKLVNICDDRCIKVYFLPVIYGFFKSPKQIELVGDLPVINIHNTPLDNKANAAIKRIIDIVGSIILIILTSPIMLVAAIGTKLSSPGPILFKQKRVGMMGKTFTMLKFRSMWVNTGSDSTWTKGADARKTKFGNFIRKTAIDELPQLFNVLMGHMSLVGPRPEIPKFVNEFRKVIPLYMVKHYVKPGMTGLAQIKGLRGDTSVEDRIHEDISYIENWSLLLDFYILLKTPFKAFNKSEQYVEREVREHPQLYGIGELTEIEEAANEEEEAFLLEEEIVAEKTETDAIKESVEWDENIGDNINTEDSKNELQEAQKEADPKNSEGAENQLFAEAQTEEKPANGEEPCPEESGAEEPCQEEDGERESEGGAAISEGAEGEKEKEAECTDKAVKAAADGEAEDSSEGANE